MLKSRPTHLSEKVSLPLWSELLCVIFTIGYSADAVMIPIVASSRMIEIRQAILPNEPLFRTRDIENIENVISDKW